MGNAGKDGKGSRSLGALVRDFIAWLKGLPSPQYVPQRAKYGDQEKKRDWEI